MNQSDDDRDGRSSVARGWLLADRATSIAAMMAVPPYLGWLADSRLKTSPWLLAAGAVFGFVASLYQLLRLAKDSDDKKK